MTFYYFYLNTRYPQIFLFNFHARLFDASIIPDAQYAEEIGPEIDNISYRIQYIIDIGAKKAVCTNIVQYFDPCYYENPGFNLALFLLTSHCYRNR